MKIDLDQIRNLLAVVGQTDITELTIESGDEKITVKKSTVTIASGSQSIEHAPQQLSVVPSRPPVQLVPDAPKVQENRNNDKPESNNGLVAITSPMVGTFYRAPSPTASSFVEVGDAVKVGQTVCIIEAMKLMNDLPSEVSGKIVKILVDNGTTVEYGQPLFMVDPAG